MNENLHICFLTHEYPMAGQTQGGIGSVVQTLGHALVNRGLRVSVVGVTRNVTEEFYEDDKGVQIYRLPAARWPAANFLPNAERLRRKLWEVHRKNPIDILEGSELSFAFVPRSFPAKKVIRMHGGHHFFAVTLGKKPAFWRAFQEKRSFAKADGLIAVSRFVGEKTKELLGFERAFEVIYNIVDTSKFHKADPKKIIPGRLLFVGTVTEKKGVRQLVQAMPKILEAFPHATLQIVGRDWKDPQTGASYTEYLQKFITPEIRHAVELVGPLPHDEIPVRIESAEICVYPSHMEAMPIAWLEALGMGKAVVASRTGPGPEAIIDGKTGLLCDPFDPDSIAKEIIWMLEHRKNAELIGQNARMHVNNIFNQDVIVLKNIEFYKNIQGRKK